MAANTYTRSQMERAMVRLVNVVAAVSFAAIPDDTKTDLSGLPTKGELNAAYLATFPAGTTPETHVTVKDRIWLAKLRKSGVNLNTLTPGEKARHEKIMVVVGPEEAKAALKREARAAEGAPQAAFDRRDLIVETMKGTASDKQIAEALAKAKLPAIGVARPAKVAKAKATPAAAATA